MVQSVVINLPGHHLNTSIQGHRDDDRDSNINCIRENWYNNKGNKDVTALLIS